MELCFEPNKEEIESNSWLISTLWAQGQIIKVEMCHNHKSIDLI